MNWGTLALAALGVVSALIQLAIESKRGLDPETARKINDQLKAQNDALRKAARIERRALTDREYREWVQRGGQSGDDAE